MTTFVEIGVRDGVRGDLSLLAAAHRFGYEAVSDARGGDLETILWRRREPIEDTFATDSEDAMTFLRVGTVDSLVVGHCVLHIEDLSNGEKLGRVRELWVHPSARGIGVGSTLMRDATATAVAHRCRGIDARALPGDRTTKNFFESFGLVARAIEVHKQLP